MGKNLIIGLCFFLLSVWAIPVYGQTCNSKSDCTGGRVCQFGPLGGECVDCIFKGDCQSGLICKNNKCIPPECTAHCDCPQGSFCYYGICTTDPNMLVYCCSNPGCLPGRWCFDPSGGKGTCAEDPNYECQSACDCGQTHACLFIPEVGKKICIKDTNDPWSPGGTALFGASIPPGEPTYCCSDPLCHAGLYAYGFGENFNCYDPAEQTASNFCGGRPCFYSGDCESGESCMDTHIKNLPLGATCNSKGGHCVSNAIAEAVYGYSPSIDMISTCSKGCFPNQICEVGWKPGGVYLFERVVGVCGSCGNGVCEPWENLHSCPQDCKVSSCGDGICSGWKTPKNCSQDCNQPVCGDGSCDPGEVTTCPQDCGCPDSPTFKDYPSLCGDGYCDPSLFSLENCVTCPHDCGVTCPQPVALCKNVTVNAGLTCTASASINNGSYIPGGSPITLTESPAGPYSKGNTSVTLKVTNIQGLSSQCTGTVTVIDNTPPSIIAPAAVTAYTGPGSTSCGAVVNDETLGTAIGSDNCPGVTVTQSGVPSGNFFPVGATTVTYATIDASGNMATAPQSVTVIDNAPPQITNISANPSILWPPNHKMVDVTVNYSVADNCLSATCSLSVTSNEPIEGTGDGDTSPDWEVVDSRHVKLRAERAGTGAGRIYTVRVMCVDSSSNPSSQNVTVSVPKDQGKK